MQCFTAKDFKIGDMMFFDDGVDNKEIAIVLKTKDDSLAWFWVKRNLVLWDKRFYPLAVVRQGKVIYRDQRFTQELVK